MIVKEIYEEYKITPSLQQHMTWVASVASIIMEKWSHNFPIDKDAVLQACLFHDVAKILSFKTFKEGEEQLQAEFKERWGDDEHIAANKIVAEIGLTKHAQDLIVKNNVKPFLEKIRNIMNSDDYEMKILKYADSRIAPQGLVTLKGRWDELIVRRSEKEGDAEANHIMTEIENQLQKETACDLQTITQMQIHNYLINLLQLTI